MDDMILIGPEQYQLTFNTKRFLVLCQNGTDKFSGIATSKLPKIYIISVNNKPIYVGVTKQSMRNRLRFGWAAQGKGGYYGYAWRHKFKKANIDIWCHQDRSADKSLLDIETVEAEVVYLIRNAGQWPLYQTEIHFHPSKTIHRKIAKRIVERYGLN